MHGYLKSATVERKLLDIAHMNHWADELHAILMHITGAINRPDIDAAFLARAGVKLDRALFPLLSRIGLAGPIGAVELADLVGRDHSTVSRQTAKLEELGLVRRVRSETDGRVRLLCPSEAGEEMLTQFRDTRRAMVEAHFRDWSEEERSRFLELLRKANVDLR